MFRSRYLYTATRLLAVVVIGAWLGVGATPAVSGTISTNDVWENATIDTHTGVISGSTPYGLFRSAGGSVEPGKTLFRDSTYSGTLHSVEWSTAAPQAIQSLTLWGAHDYGKTARGLRRFRVWAYDDATQGFTKELCDIRLGYPYASLTSTDYYANVSTGLNNGLELNVNVAPVSTTRWRAEFTQMAGGAWAGPRVMELDGFTSRHAGLSGTAPLKTNLWHHATVTGHSGVLSGTHIDNVFGRAYGSIEGARGYMLFRDDKPAGYVHWIEFKTPSPVTVRSMLFEAAHDSGRLRRSVSRIKLYAYDDASGAFDDLVFDMDLGWPYSATIERPDAVNLGTSNAIILSAGLPPTTAQRFRAEFTQRAAPPWPGPRISELSASGDPAEGVTPPTDPNQSTIAAAPSVISTFGGTSLVTVTLRDTNGALVTDPADVELQTTGGTLVDEAVHQGDGTYTQELLPAVGQSQAVVSATVDGVALTSTTTVTFVPVDLASSVVEATHVEVLEGGETQVIATLRDGLGSTLSGFDVMFQTTLGQLVGTVEDLGDGRYAQTIELATPGSALITATVEGLPITDDASIIVTSVDDVEGVAIGLRDDGTWEGYETVQEALNAVSGDGLDEVVVKPGRHAEYVRMKDLDLADGFVLSAYESGEPVVIDGLRIDNCTGVSVLGLTMDGWNAAAHVVHIRGSEDIEFDGCRIMSAASGFDGVRIDKGNRDLVIRDSVVEQNSENGIRCMSSTGPCTIVDCRIAENGAHGVRLGKQVVVTLEHNDIVDNGALSGGYGLYVQRQSRGGSPEDVTLRSNLFDGNHGRVVPGKSDEDIRNYDQVIDPTDEQLGY